MGLAVAGWSTGLATAARSFGLATAARSFGLATAARSFGLATAERSFGLATAERSTCCAYKASVFTNTKTKAQIEERTGQREKVTHTSEENGAKPKMISLQPP